MKRLGLILLTGSIFTFSGLTSCAASQNSHTSTVSESVEMATSGQAEADFATDTNLAKTSDEANALSTESPESATTASRPQLIKRANLSLDVDSVEDSFAQVRAIVNAQNGDVLEMQDYGDRQRNLTFVLRVPQARLDATLEALTEIGEVRSRSIETQDVSSQLVDLSARISNAKKSEAALQEIMSRSGEIADVLEVSRELSKVRQEIETMSATQKNLQTQVSYSTIRLSLQSAIAMAANKPGFSTQVANSWNEATDSVGEFTTDLVQLGLWLLVYSPYLVALLVCGALLANKLRRRSAQG